MRGLPLRFHKRAEVFSNVKVAECVDPDVELLCILIIADAIFYRELFHLLICFSLLRKAPSMKVDRTTRD